MKALITGGAGFIGSWLARDLLARGVKVIVVDDLSTGRWPNPILEPHPDVDFIEGDCADRALTADLVGRSDIVFHLASVVGVQRLMRSPLDAALVNHATTATVLAAAAAAGRPVVLTSSSEVYGPLGQSPFHEDAALSIGRPEESRWTYALSKAAGEQLAFAHGRERGLSFVVARLFNTIGPGQSPHYGMVLPRFVTQALGGAPLTIYGDGLQTRTFVDVRDVTGALLALAERRASWGRVYNIGGVETVSVLDLAHRVRTQAKSASPIKHIPYAEVFDDNFVEARHRRPDIGRVHETVGWRPTRSLDETIADVVSSFGRFGTEARQA